MVSFARINPAPLTAYDRLGRTRKGEKQNVPFLSVDAAVTSDYGGHVELKGVRK